MNKKNIRKSDISGEIDIAFARLVGPLVIMSKLKSYEKSHKEIKDLLNIISEWGVEFQREQNLLFIDSNQLLDIYYRLDALKDEYLFDDRLGLESELSDEVVIWMYELMELRKQQIEGGVEK